MYLTSVRLFDYCAMLVSVVLNYSLIKLMNKEKSWLYGQGRLWAASTRDGDNECFHIAAITVLWV